MKSNKTNLEIEDRGIGLSPRKLESAEKYANANSNTIGKEEGLAEVTNGISHTRGLVSGMITRRGLVAAVMMMRSTRRYFPLPPLKLLNSFPEPFLRLMETALSVQILGGAGGGPLGRGRWRRGQRGERGRGRRRRG